MSGIAAIVHFDGRPVEPGAIEAMVSTMAHRGPDGISFWRGTGIALGHAMLRTTPEAKAETQPLSIEEAGLVLIMDGRVDNRADLRRQLLARGVALQSIDDAELVLRSYEAWGRQCLDHLDGDFALVIWDARRREVFCARDRMGNKPFFWHWAGQTLVVASEPQAVLTQAPAAHVLNEGMLSDHLAAHHLSMTETLWRGLMRLAPAHRMVVDRAGPKPERYWSPNLRRELLLGSDEAYAEHYRALLFDIVAGASHSDHALAFEVSGGLDSSAVFGVAAALQRQGRLVAPSMAGYNLNFAGDPAADETAHCRAVARHTGIPVHEIKPEIMGLAWYASKALQYQDFPDFPNGAAMASPVARRAAADGARVVLTGLGGDQWLCGSSLMFGEALQRGQIGELARLLNDHAQTHGISGAAWALLRFGVAPLLPSRVRQALRALAGKGDTTGDVDCLSPAMRELHASRLALWQAAHPTRVPRLTQRNQVASLNDAYQMQCIELHEREVASHGMELRQPFWNARMVEFALATPARLRLQAGTDKWLHRQAMAGLLPDSVLQRQDKAEFSTLFSDTFGTVGLPHMRAAMQRRSAWLNIPVAEQALSSFSGTDRAQWDYRAMWTLWSAMGLDMLAPLPGDSPQAGQRAAPTVEADPLTADPPSSPRG